MRKQTLHGLTKCVVWRELRLKRTQGIQCDPTDKVWLSEFSTSSSWHTIDESSQILYAIETVIPGYLWNRRAIPLTPGPRHGLSGN